MHSDHAYAVAVVKKQLKVDEHEAEAVVAALGAQHVEDLVHAGREGNLDRVHKILRGEVTAEEQVESLEDENARLKAELDALRANQQS